MTPTRELGKDAQPTGTKPIHQSKDQHMTTANALSTDLIPADAAPPAPYDGVVAAGAEDLAIPRLYVGQPGSSAVQDELLRAGSLYLADDATDPAPRLVHEPGGLPALLYALAMKKTWIFRDEEDRFTVGDRALAERYPAGEPGYQFLVMVPAVDAELPASWLLKSTAMSAGRKIITAITRGGSERSWAHAFEVVTHERSNQLGRWWVPAVSEGKANAKHVAAADKAVKLLGLPG